MHRARERDGKFVAREKRRGRIAFGFSVDGGAFKQVLLNKPLTREIHPRKFPPRGHGVAPTKGRDAILPPGYSDEYAENILELEHTKKTAILLLCRRYFCNNTSTVNNSRYSICVFISTCIEHDCDTADSGSNLVKVNQRIDCLQLLLAKVLLRKWHLEKHK